MWGFPQSTEYWAGRHSHQRFYFYSLNFLIVAAIPRDSLVSKFLGGIGLCSIDMIPPRVSVAASDRDGHQGKSEEGVMVEDRERQ